MKNITLGLFLILSIKASSQDFSECRVDFSLLETEESIDKDDIGKTYIFIIQNLPDYKMKYEITKTKNALMAEFEQKRRENKDYNNNNTHVIDSLNKLYEDILDNGFGKKLYWLEELRDASEKEISTFNKETYKKSNSNNPTDKYRFSSTKFISIEEFNIFKILLMIEDSDKEVSSKSYSDYIRPYNYMKADKQPPKIETYFESFEKAKERYDLFIKFKLPLLYNGKVYQLMNQRIPYKSPIFYEMPIGLNRMHMFSNVFPLGYKPVFYFKDYNSKPLTLIDAPDLREYIGVKDLIFQVDNKCIGLINYIVDSHWEGSNLVKENKSVNYFYDLKRLEKVNEYLTNLKKSELTINSYKKNYNNQKIVDFIFNISSLSLILSNKDTINYWAVKDPSFIYSIEINKNKGAKYIYDIPVFNSICYDKKINEFKNQTLRKDAYNNPELKNILSDAIIRSPQWFGYLIKKVILNEKSIWFIERNKYTGIIDSRTSFADIYFQDINTKKCYYARDVYFTQKYDIIYGFIYSFFVSMPTEFNDYPCELNK